MKISNAALFLWLALICWGCASSSILGSGEKTVVRYQQYDGETGTCSLELILVEETNEEYDNLYSEKSASANIKKVPLDTFRFLVDTLEDLGFVDRARPLPLGVAPRRTGVLKMIVVENTAGQWVLDSSKENWVGNHPNEWSVSEKKDYKMMLDLIRNCYNSVFSLQVIQNEDGRNYFLEEQRRLREENKERSKQ